MNVFSINKYANLHIDDMTGIAYVTDGSTGLTHSAHPNIDKSGSVAGMKKRGYWRKEDKIVSLNGYFYNISMLSYDKDDLYDRIAARECRCSECLRRKAESMHSENLN